MEPKKIAIFVILLVGLVFAGRWACAKWHYYNPPPQTPPAGGAYPGYGGYGKAKAPAAPVAPVQ